MSSRPGKPLVFFSGPNLARFFTTCECEMLPGQQLPVMNLACVAGIRGDGSLINKDGAVTKKQRFKEKILTLNKYCFKFQYEVYSFQTLYDVSTNSSTNQER